MFAALPSSAWPTHHLLLGLGEGDEGESPDNVTMSCYAVDMSAIVMLACQQSYNCPISDITAAFLSLKG